MAKDTYKRNEDYEMSYDEYLAANTKQEETVSIESVVTSAETAEAASADSAAGEAVEEAADAIEEQAENAAESASKFTPGALLKTGLTMIAKQFGISGRAATIIISLLGSTTVATFLFGSSNSTTVFTDQADDCIVDSSFMVYNEKYEFPTQEEKDGYARAMYHILSAKEITKPWVDDDSLIASNGLLWFPSLVTCPDCGRSCSFDDDACKSCGASLSDIKDESYEKDEEGNNVLDEEGNSVINKTSKAFSPEAIIGMISNADAESSLTPDSYEYNFGVGPQDDKEKEDTILSTFHHYNWDIYCERMFKKYEGGGTGINQSAYEYTDRVSGDKHLYVGMGLWGWTGPLAYELQEFCDTFEDPWEMNGDKHNDAMYTMSGQLAFLLYSEDWFDWLEKSNKETEAGTLKNFKVQVPSASGIQSEFGSLANKLGVDLSGLDDMNMYELCEKMREIEAKWEEAWLTYTNKEQLEELEKIREKWDEKVENCLTEEKVTVKEWAAVNELYYEVHYWCYIPEAKELVNEYFKDESPKGVSCPPSTTGVKADESPTTVVKNWGLDGKPKRLESKTPIYFDQNEFDSRDDYDNRYAIDAAYNAGSIWDEDEKDIWIWDLHVEVIARDRFGRILKRVSDPDSDDYWGDNGKPEPNKVNNANPDTYGAVAKSNNGYNYNHDEQNGYPDGESAPEEDGGSHLKVSEIKTDDNIDYDSRVWSDDEFDQWYEQYSSSWSSDWQSKYDEVYPDLYDNYIEAGYLPYQAHYLARKSAGASAESYADSNGYANAQEFTDKLVKELEFDVRADIGDPANPDTDEASDNDGVSVGGLAAETLAKDYFEYFVFGSEVTPGASSWADEQLQKHLANASKYYEQYLGTQEDWYPDKEHDTSSNDEHDTWDEKDHTRLDENDEKINDFPVDWGWYPSDELAELVVGLWDPKADSHDNSCLNDMRKENAQRHCGIVVNTDTIADTAVALSWPQGNPQLATFNTTLLDTEGEYYTLRLCTELYVAVKDLVFPEENPRNRDRDVTYSGVTLYSSCDRGAMTIAMASGADPVFYNAFPEEQIKHCEKSPLWYDVLNNKVVFEDDEIGDEGGDKKTIKSKEDLDKLQPGDFLISKQHIMVFVGPEAVLKKYPDLLFDEYVQAGGQQGLNKTYEEWFTETAGKYSLVHSSHGKPEDVQKEGNETSRGLMVQPVSSEDGDYEWLLNGEWLGEGSDDGYRVFRCTNQDLASVGPKWAVNAKWITLRNLPKGEIRNGAYINMLRAEEARRRGLVPDEEEETPVT